MSVPEVSVMHVEPNLSKQSVPTVVSVYTQGSHNMDILNPFFLSDIDETSSRSLSGVHANKCILRLLPNMEVSSMLSMGSYALILCVLTGAFRVLVDLIYSRIILFQTFAFWDWRTPVILQDGMVPMTTSASEIRSLMPIRLPCRPHEYCHSNITKSTFYRIRTEFHRGHALTKLEELQSFCDPNPTEYVDVNVTELNIVFYWDLGRIGFFDSRSVKEYFVQSIRAGYQGRTGKMNLSVVQASQLPKNA
ncbi:hypothetical protein TEA_021869 [Camellia sinensis var. sinensis]|uniref:Uncharacterized protein n=1 Tax=Camellia sinensis var. sinensis TaxID=542762 RepID=A0A4S4EEH1_CAMSN|nr:hypothetical protein TEA_021869 [Camellia sinensis var. sinensis]